MTISNVIFEGGRVRLVSDTLSYRNKSPVAFGRKIRVIEDADFAVVVRGQVALGDQIEGRAERCESFSFACGYFGECLQTVPQRLLKSSGAEVTIAGIRQGQLAVTRFMLRIVNGDVAVNRFDLEPGVYLAPSLGSHTIPPDMTDEQLFRVALLQQDISLRNNLNMCIGGDVEVATLEVGKPITIRKLGEYPDKAKTAKLIARALPKHRQMMAA